MKIEILACSFGLVVASLASPTDTILEEWKVKLLNYILKSKNNISIPQTWKLQHGKQYGSHYSHEEIKRKNIWMDNTAMIERHNQEFFKGQHTFTMKMNKFGDLTNDEFRAMMNG